jgi:hypothetical protein
MANKYSCQVRAAKKTPGFSISALNGAKLRTWGDWLVCHLVRIWHLFTHRQFKLGNLSQL